MQWIIIINLQDKGCYIFRLLFLLFNKIIFAFLFSKIVRRRPYCKRRSITYFKLSSFFSRLPKHFLDARKYINGD